MPPAAGDGDDDRDPFDDVAADVGDDGRTSEEVWREFETTDTDPGAVWDRLDDEVGTDIRPLSSVDRDESERTNGHDEDDAAADFRFPADAADPPADHDEDDGGRSADPAGDDPDPGRTVGISNLTKIIHGYVTAMLVGSALTIYVGTALGAFPRHLWILSLPLLAVAAFLLVPVLAWQFGYWHPTRLS